MSGFWQGLLSDMALLAALVSVWTNARDQLRISNPRLLALCFGAFMGAGAVLSMVMGLELRPGLFVDMRAPLIAMAGFFGGPIGALSAAAVSLLYRVSTGGVGVWAGGVCIAASALIGAVGNRLTRHRATEVRDICVLSLATAVFAAASSALLPRSVWPLILPAIEGPATLLNFVGALLAGLAILHHDRFGEALHANMMYRAIVETLPDCLNFKDLEGRFAVANSATARLMHAPSASDLIGKTDYDFYPQDVARQFEIDEKRVIAEGRPHTIEQHAHFKDGSARWISTLKTPLRDERGRIIGLITHNRDITNQKQMQADLQTAHQRFAEALDHMADGLLSCDPDGVILFCNERHRRLFPLTAYVRVPGARIVDVIRESIVTGERPYPETDDIETWIADHARSLLIPGDRIIELTDRWVEARTRRVSGGGSLILSTDISDRKRAEDELARANRQLAELVLSDALTGLVNRRGFDQALEREFARSARNQSPLSLLLIDVDKFKRYNDRYGHQSGDRCLQLVGKQLHDSVRRSADTAARYGGEEFVVILPDTPPEGAAEVGERCRQAVRSLAIAHIGGIDNLVTVSIGVASYVPGRELDRPEELLRRADEALYVAKAEGRDRVSLDLWTYRAQEPIESLPLIA